MNQKNYSKTKWRSLKLIIEKGIENFSKIRNVMYIYWTVSDNDNKFLNSLHIFRMERNVNKWEDENI